MSNQPKGLGALCLLGAGFLLSLYSSNVWAQTATDLNCVECVSNAEIEFEAVGTGRIATEAVTNAKIAFGAVRTGRLADEAVTNAKIAPFAVREGRIAPNAVSTTKIQNGAVTAAKLAEDAVFGRIIVVRKVGGEQVPIEISLKRAVLVPEERLLIQPGDFIMLEYTEHEMWANLFLSVFQVNYFLGN